MGNSVAACKTCTEDPKSEFNDAETIDVRSSLTMNAQQKNYVSKGNS